MAELTKLRGKIHVKHGWSFKGEHFAVQGKYILLTPGNFLDAGGFKFDPAKAKYYTAGFPEEYLCSQGDLVLVMTEQTPGLLGGTAFVPEDGRFLHNQRIGLVTLDETCMDKTFVYYLFNTEVVRKQLRASSSGSKVKHTSPDRIYEVLAPIPELYVQQRIGRLLSALDAKIALNTRINTELEALAKLIYDYWFVQFDFPNAKGQPYKSSGGAMVVNKELKREVPEGWEVVNLLEEMDVQYGFPFDTNQFTEDTKAKPVVRIRDILGCSFSAYSTQVVHEKYALQSGDLLIGMDGNFHMNYWDRDAGYLNQRSVRIRSPRGSSVSTVQCLYDIQPHIKAREASVSRTTVGHLSDKDLKRLYVLVPEESKSFQPKETFDGLLALMLSNRIQNQELTTLRDWLLPLLMNGQVVVGSDDRAIRGSEDQTIRKSENENAGMALAAEPAGRYGKKK